MLYSQLHITSYSLVWFWVLLLLLLRLAFIHPVIKSPFQTLRDISLGRRVELKSPAPAKSLCCKGNVHSCNSSVPLYAHVLSICVG